MRSPAANRRRRSTRNRRNRQPSTTTNQRPAAVFVPKTDYANSYHTASGLLVLSKRKRAPPTEEEKERKKQKKLTIKKKQVALSTLRHEVVGLWKHGMHTDERQFGPKSSADIIKFLQETYEQYEKLRAASSFYYRTINRHKTADESPHLDPMRDRRGENRKRPKRDDARTIELVDELLSVQKSRYRKVKQRLQTLGFSISTATIGRIAKDLCFHWVKPWHTDLLTEAQKYKRNIFCRKHLLLSERELFNVIINWLFGDEKWWDIVGPSSAAHVKADSKIEAKQQNKVCFFIFACLFVFFIFACLFVCCVICIFDLFIVLACILATTGQNQKGGSAKACLFLGQHLLVGQIQRGCMVCRGQQGVFQAHEKPLRWDSLRGRGHCLSDNADPQHVRQRQGVLLQAL